jgi:UDP-N-acetylmuramoyl-L-alanyl-D-glutamate--2,6-diaminopimelate ligase
MTFDELTELVSSAQGPRVRADSRLVEPGDVFVAVPGTSCDGHDFIADAVARGAGYIVCQNHRPLPQRPDQRCEVIFVDDSAKAAALLAQAARGNPAPKLINLAVTGTNGKTTVAFLVRSCIQQAGHKCGLIGTVVYDTGSAERQADLTTPDCFDIAHLQSQMVQAGTHYMVMEASSHALSQNRLSGIQFKAAAFTNLSGDHLDYHETKENYLDTKVKLFRELPSESVAVLNKQSPEAKEVARKTNAQILWYAVDAKADLTAHTESMGISGTVFSLEYADRHVTVRTPLLGRYNISNHLAAAGLCLAAGFELEAVASGLAALKVIAGRLEKVDCPVAVPELCRHVIIDYAHTDDALNSVLSTLKPLCRARLITVFGCGGDRDRTKRPRMARAAEEWADSVIVTSDNPRTERPEKIIDDIVAGFQNPDSQRIIIEPDRKRAIELGIETAGSDDIVVIAGKGHETYQIIETQKIHFSDKEVAEQCLQRLRPDSSRSVCWLRS